MWDYWEMVGEYFLNAMNAGVLKAAAAGAISCSKTLELMTRVDPVAEAVAAAKSRSLRCSSAIPSSSVIAELIIATTADEAHRLIHRVNAGFIDGQPPDRTHRSAVNFTRSADFRGRGRFSDREPGALLCKNFGVDEGVIRRTSVSTDSPPASRLFATRSLLAAGARAPKQRSKCLSAAMQQCSRKTPRRERRPVSKTKAAVDTASSTCRNAVKGVRSPEGCGGCNLVNIGHDQPPSPRRPPRSRVCRPRSSSTARATRTAEHMNVHVIPRPPGMQP
ncbi:iron-sulfur cluster assembly scaffold protein [Ensifer sp. P24N7]|uniref:iron-sulfur cluster assembly scaffold protein n=1 Tax=Sinorhizobium sp. P24N7 TaxID=3348358 RepID=UPI0035F31BB4